MRPPNLLFLYTDQQRYDTLAAYGNHRIQMPHLNRLAEQSVVFDQAYCTQPVCTPSRAALQSGLWPHQSDVVTNNLPLPAAIPTLVEMLPDDVATGHFGKWHLGDEIYPQHGYQEWRAVDDTYWPFYSAGRDRVRHRSSHHHWLVEHGVRPWAPDPKLTLVSCPQWHKAPRTDRLPYDQNRFSREQITALPESLSKPAYLAEEAIAFLRRHQRDRFALYVNFFEPHHPLGSPRDGQYRPEEMELAAAHDHVPDETVPLGAAQTHAEQFARTFDGTPVATAADQRRAIAKYWGMCSLVDTHVGRILAKLAELGLEDDTLVFFSTDHGEMMGAHGMWGKGVMYEASVRVPLLLRVPGQRRGSRVRGPVSQIDVVPTLLDYLGVNGPVLPGQSLRPAIETGVTTRDVFVEWNPSQLQGESARTIVTAEGWKLTVSSQGRHELRNLNDDPWETGPNRIADSLAGTLAGRLRDWQQRTADKLELPFTMKSAALASPPKGKRQ